MLDYIVRKCKIIDKYALNKQKRQSSSSLSDESPKYEAPMQESDSDDPDKPNEEADAALGKMSRSLTGSLLGD